MGAWVMFQGAQRSSSGWSPGRELWGDFVWSVDVQQYVSNFWDEKLMKFPIRELDPTMLASRCGEY
jgi:hypothetical protein